MAIKDKISKQDSKKIEEFISKGAPVVSDHKSKKPWITVSLRVTAELLEDMDNAVEKRIGMNRNTWILEALQEKLEKI